MNASLPLRIGSLFSGIGALEWGLERAGVGQVVWQVESEPYCRAVLAEHWPTAQRHTDVRLCGIHNLSPVEVLCGGFPCQDLSVAGAGAGLDGERSSLVWELLRIARELEPCYLVMENVPALAVRGLDRLLGALAEGGYDAIWDHLSAAALGAPHRRDRLFLIAWIADPQRRRERLARRCALADAENEQLQAPVGADAARVAGSSDGSPPPLADAHGDGQPQPTRGEPGERGWTGDGSTPPLADAHGERRHLGAGPGEPPPGQRQPPDGAPVADAEREPAQLRRGRRLVRGTSPAPAGARRERQRGGDAAAHRGAALEDASRERRQAPQRRGEDAPPADRAPESAACERAGAAEPGLGGVPDGLPGGVDPLFPGWPAPRGAAQHAWEPPRLARPSRHAKARLRALGNAVVPQVAYVVGRWLIQLHHALQQEVTSP